MSPGPGRVASQSSTSCEQVVVSASIPARESTVLSNSPQGSGSHRLTEREKNAEVPAAESQGPMMSAASVMFPKEAQSLTFNNVFSESLPFLRACHGVTNPGIAFKCLRDTGHFRWTTLSKDCCVRAPVTGKCWFQAHAEPLDWNF